MGKVDGNHQQRTVFQELSNSEEEKIVLVVDSMMFFFIANGCKTFVK